MSGAMPFAKFFWSDYASDPALKICSFAAQGLWMRMLCIASEHDPIGYVAVNGRGLDGQAIARATGGSLEEVATLLAELESNGVYSLDRRGWIYSRRMIRDAKKAKHAQKIGKKGGNPNLRKQRENPAQDNRVDKGQVNGEDKPHIPESRNQSPEGASSNVENNLERGGGEPPTNYAFFGRTIKLNGRDLEKWRRTYHSITDLDAELTTLDAWWETQPAERRKNWFHPTAGMLNRKHQEILTVRDEASRGGGEVSVPC